MAARIRFPRFKKMMIPTAIVSLLCATFHLPGWFDNTHAQTAAENNITSSETEWDKRWWLDKAARLLRGGEGLSPDDDIKTLLALPKDEVVRRFMADPRFGNTMLDFNMYFLGFKADSVRIDGRYADHAFDYPNAISAAQEIVKNGDYLKLFDLEGPFFMAPLRTDDLVDPLPAEEQRLMPEQLRIKVIGEFREVLSQLLPSGSAITPIDARAYCNKIEAVIARDDEISDHFFRAFNDAEIFALMRGRIVRGPLETIARITEDECSARKVANIDVSRMTSVVERALVQFDKAAAEIAKFEPSIYQPRTIAEFRKFDLAAFGSLTSWLAFGYEQSATLVNSSTNFNRKRSAYVLKQFFCDDLNPVGIDDPMEHVRGDHGSATSCYACHYKLDPMAGFFRSYGALFADNTQSPDLVFDDLASTGRRDYVAHWRASQGSERQWDVGYVRSPRWPQQNAYGETLGDLSRIIRSAPEAKRCLMKRLVEYSVGADQTVDGGYVDELATRFAEQAAVNSSVAMKDAITSVVTSRGFMQRNRDPKTCYDFAQRERANGPPCRVAAILEKNCSQCHDSAYDGEGNLDLTRWEKPATGQAPTFPHFDHAMDPVARSETLRMMAERLASNDPRKRMPKNKPMASQERQELFLWAEQTLKESEAGESR